MAWGADEPAPGLLAAGGALDADSLSRAYASGIFPWFGAGDPILWWSPDPRMVLEPRQFKLHRSLLQVLKRFVGQPACEVRFDTAFGTVIRACAHRRPPGATADAPAADTWILPEMVAAYEQLHRLGLAHSVETWIDGELAGGLYCVALGRAVFGESMFSHQTDASKIALAALVAFCRIQGVDMIDCQQNTAHLASLGAAPISRAVFLQRVQAARREAAPDWQFRSLYWAALSPKLTQQA